MNDNEGKRDVCVPSVNSSVQNFFHRISRSRNFHSFLHQVFTFFISTVSLPQNSYSQKNKAQGTSSIKIVDLLASKINMKNIFRRAVQFRESLSQKLEYVKSIVVIVYDLLNRQQPSNLGVTCIRSLEEELKGGKRVAKVCEVENRVNLGPTSVHDARDAETRDGHFAIPRRVPRPLFASRFNYFTKVSALSFPAAVARCERKNNPS